MPTKTTQNVAFVFDDLTEFYSARELIDALRQKGIPTDIIVPHDSGYNGLAKHTFEKIKQFNYSPLKDAPKNKTYKVVLSPYPTIEVIYRMNYVYQIRLPYSTISAKPDPVYNTEFKIDYDAIICFNNYEPTFLNSYGADCYAVPYWKYYNFKKISTKSEKPTLLILPTFGQDTSCIQYLSDSIVNEIKKHFKVIIKAHHATHFGKDGDKTLEIIKKLADDFYDSDTPITDLLKKADIVLSDNSGSIFEAIYSNTPIVTFSKDLNTRQLEGIDTLQYQLSRQGILPHTNDPKKIVSLLLSSNSFFKKQQEIKKTLFPKTTKNSIDITVGIIEQYLKKDEQKDYKKILHNIMLREWFSYKKSIASLESKNYSLELTINSLKEKNQLLNNKIGDLQYILNNQNEVLNSGAFRLYNKLITPYKKIKSMRHKK